MRIHLPNIKQYTSRKPSLPTHLFRFYFSKTSKKRFRLNKIIYASTEWQRFQRRDKNRMQHEQNVRWSLAKDHLAESHGHTHTCYMLTSAKCSDNCLINLFAVNFGNKKPFSCVKWHGGYAVHEAQAQHHRAYHVCSFRHKRNTKKRSSNSCSSTS